MNNPFLEPYNTPFEVPPFDRIKNEHYMPALKEGISKARAEIQAIADSDEAPTFKNTIEAMEAGGDLLERVTSVLFNLNSAETNDELQAVARDASPLLSEFDNEIKQNEKLWQRIKDVYSRKEEFDLTDEQKMLLEKTYKGFVRSGADLDGKRKERYKEVAIELSKLSLQFGENLLAETNDYLLVIDEEKDLAGLPKDVVSRAAETAKQKGHEGKWAFTLQAPSYIPFMEYADKRELREELFKAYMRKAFKGNDRDNQEIVKKLAALRAEKAALLGYSTYAEYVLEERMAETPDKVQDFLQDLLERAMPKAKEEVEEIKAFMQELGADHDLQRWDWAYYSEKLRKKKYDLDDELTKPYFKLENCIDGVFQTAEKLFDISFRKNDEIPVYHEDVQAYEVLDADGQTTAIFFADFFPRDGKRGGAWMTSYRDQRRFGGVKVIPHVSIVCNFTPSSADTPSLLKFDEVKTLFHEFGHALHGMLADTHYASLSGTHVYWDFVELPSQILENWCYEKECLDLFAKHYETGELIPAEYVERLKKSAIYHEAYATVRQLSFGLLDLNWHHITPERAGTIDDVSKVEQEAFAPTDLFPAVPGTNMSVQFGHIFGGGYASGYYSYKWAEVLDADAFSVFQEKGVFDKETAQRFKATVLSQGGTQHPMDLYKAFRGQEPKPDALLRRAGLKD
ncbi:M3 family metallopeptidase [Marinoscillum furvescens]|uniref:Peptidyl-dipeptidase Dcp n=1 Tax=Marinoscillum furvescens DSM 4134 TaxID=1122208 RepID=A0A3D9KX14_MARFU|nr:M3 family metallopeptidase [Marinoscillum furvescens]RED93177.1 peptidyl-dipeptidase Dcp [Marinoscillum furvescens DSM 4134]